MPRRSGNQVVRLSRWPCSSRFAPTSSCEVRQASRTAGAIASAPCKRSAFPSKCRFVSEGRRFRLASPPLRGVLFLKRGGCRVYLPSYLADRATAQLGEGVLLQAANVPVVVFRDRKSTRLNSSHVRI